MRIFLDIETAASKAFIWKMWKENIPWDRITDHWYILCWSALIEETGEVVSDSLHYHKRAFRKDFRDDSKIMASLWSIMDRADVIIAHNGDGFDIPKINTRFIQNRFTPPSPYRTIDTYKVAKNKFGFTSNRLDHLGEALGVGRKIPTTWPLWDGCMNGDRESFDRMVEYNQQDVLLLRDVFNRMSPWLGSQHNRGRIADSDKPVCQACESDNLIRKGYYYTNTQKYQRFVCKDCGAWCRARQGEDRGLQKVVGI